ncbi:immunoglobulin-like domain-containing protein [Rubritalea marina]|uniref:immunoglobulin-like domain-containing protein n=1 Tax=Rubritalea marina TaxID=361055 RepID=UPI0003702FDD|nr:immunoglobulin-like domain-containing protein [Rubritalea marina]
MKTLHNTLSRALWLCAPGLLCTDYSQAQSLPSTEEQAQLLSNERLTQNEYLQSLNLRYRFKLQGDGNLVLRDQVSGAAYWSSQTQQSGGNTLYMQGDGNLVLRDNSGSAIWDSSTVGTGAPRLSLEKNGDLVLSHDGRQVWQVAGPGFPTGPWTDALAGGNSLIQGESLIAMSNQFALSLNADGNVVLNDRNSNEVLWSTNTEGSTASQFILHQHGELALYDDFGQPLWNSQTTTEAAPRVYLLDDGTLVLFDGDTPVWMMGRYRDRLGANESLELNQRLYSANGTFRFTFQGDGNLVLRDQVNATVVWASGTDGVGATRLKLQNDGNLVLRNAVGQALWSSETMGSGIPRLVVQNDGALTILQDDEIVWSTNALTPEPDETAPILSLIGENQISIVRGESYQDAGATAEDDTDGDLSEYIESSGLVDSFSYGSYTITYTVADAAGNTATPLTRSVEVVAPSNNSGTLTPQLLSNDQLLVGQPLISENGRFILQLLDNGTLSITDRELDAEVWNLGGNGDAYRVRLQGDGNLVIRDTAGQALWASGTDASGITARLELNNQGVLVLYHDEQAVWWQNGEIVVADTTAPTITLNGASTVTLTRGGNYSEQGATATDNVDGDLTGAISITGSVNTLNSGSYSINYNVSDAAGNAATTITRTILVEDSLNDSGSSTRQLLGNERLYTGDLLISDNSQFTFGLDNTGDLQLRDAIQNLVLWSAGTGGQDADRLTMQNDGNLVLRDSTGQVIWANQVMGSSPKLELMDSGMLALFHGESLAWWVNGDPGEFDIVAPVITLAGNAVVTINQGESFVDPGASANDNVDGDLSGAISVGGSVDTQTPNTYTLSYDVTDAAGNAALTVRRQVIVLNPQEPEPDNELDTTQSSGRFSSPDAALYSLNDTRPIVPSRPINSRFNGNGHAETWDGRVFIRTISSGWVVSVLRPERITRDSDGAPNFSNAFSNSAASSRVHIEVSNGSAHHVNWLGIVPDPAFNGANPHPSDASGNVVANGEFLTYKALVIHTTEQFGTNKHMGHRRATIVVQNPNTADASVRSARFTTSFQKYTYTNGSDFLGIEPSISIDGRLIIFQGHPSNDGRIDNLVYSWNPTPGATQNWSTVRSVADMYHVDRDRDIAGQPFQIRYPLAQQPLRDAEGNTYNTGDLVKGAYPWISRDGSELFYQASRDGVNGRRTGTTVTGRWTGGLLRHIDGPINPFRHRSTRLFVSSPGAFTTMWSPFKDVKDLAIPYSVRGPAYPIFGSNSQDYSEVGFNDFLDGNHVLYFGMNEMLNRDGNYQVTRTPDTSGNDNNGTMVGARFPLEYNNQDSIVGRHGQAIYFPPGSYVRVEKNRGWDTLDQGFTVDFFVRVLDSGTRMFSIDGLLEVGLGNNGQAQATLRNTAGESFSVSGNNSVPNNQWVHLAVTYQAGGMITLYQDAQVIAQSNAAELGDLNFSGEVSIGPRDSDGLFIIDEVKLSNVERQHYEIAHNAYVNLAEPASDELQALIPPHFEQLSSKAIDVDRFSSAAAALGGELFFETRLSRASSTSCATCHVPEQTFTDGRALAQSNEPNGLGDRNTPHLFNRLFSTHQGWGGNAARLDQQAQIPIEASHEMNLSMEEAIAFLASDSHYAQRFQEVYNEAPNSANLTAALGSFQATQFSPEAAVDRYWAGDEDALDASQLRGLDLFMNKARCSGCHDGPNFTDESFRANGIVQNADTGRARQTGRSRDFKLFKVPSLRHVGQTAPYMHDGSVATLQEVVESYNQAGRNTARDIDTDIRPLELSPQEIEDLVRFLESL